MKKAIAIKWAEMLESGLINQVYGKNRTAAGMCVMGMMNNVHAVAHPAVAKTQMSPLVYMGGTYGASEPVRKWAGLKSSSGFTLTGPKINYNGVKWESLLRANDAGKVPFPVLAAYIRKNYATL